MSAVLTVRLNYIITLACLAAHPTNAFQLWEPNNALIRSVFYPQAIAFEFFEFFGAGEGGGGSGLLSPNAQLFYVAFTVLVQLCTSLLCCVRKEGLLRKSVN